MANSLSQSTHHIFSIIDRYIRSLFCVDMQSVVKITNAWAKLFNTIGLSLILIKIMSLTIGELLLVTVDPENSQKILCINSCEQSSSPTIATYENQALGLVFIYRNSSAILIVGGHWRVKCFVLSYKFSSPVNCDI